ASPYIDQDQAAHRHGAVAQPQDSLRDEPGVHEHPVEHAERRVEHPLPGERAEDRGHDPGKEHPRPDDPLESEVVVQEQRRHHPQSQLEEGRDEGVDERVLERAEKDRVVQVHAKVFEPDEGAGPSDHLVADRQPDAEDERVGDETGQDHEGGCEQNPRQDVLSLEKPAQPARTASLRHRHHDGDGNGGGGRTRMFRHLRCSYAYAFFSSPSAHLAASSGFMPLMAWAYMSTRMYLTRASEAFRLGWPGYPGQRPNFDDSLKGTSLGSRSHKGCFSQYGVGPTT